MKRLLYLTTLALISVYCYSQTICTTPAETSKDATQSQKRAVSRSYGDSLSYYLKVYFHVIRQTNGTGGQSYSNVTEAYNILNNDFNQHRIFFIWDGSIDYIDDSSLYDEASSDVFLQNKHQDGIDIYLFPDSNNECMGSANGVGVSSELFVSGIYWKSPYPSFITSHVVSHEMGHVLNLFHTHHGTYFKERETNDCAELVNGSNSITCGDFITDTPADPYLGFNVNPVTFTWNSSGIDANGDAYHPDVRLIMSYTDPRCMQYFTPMQGMVMRSAIEDLTFLQNTVIATMNPSLTGKTVMCDTANYALIGVPTGLSVSWSIDNSNFSISPSGNQCFVTYTGTPQYSVANLTATVSWSGTTIKTLTKRIVMHGTDLLVDGWQIGTYSPNGTYPDVEFTIPNNRTSPSRAKLERLLEEDLADKESLPIEFTRDLTNIHPGTPPVDSCGYGFTEIYGGNMVYLNSDRFDGMNISFSGPVSPTYLYRSESSGSVIFNLPYQNSVYYTTLHAQSDDHCHDFCLGFKVQALPGAASGDDEICVDYTGSMLNITFLGSIGTPMPNYSVTITKIPAGTIMYSNTFPGYENYFSVNTSSWTSGIYSIRIVQNGHIYNKTFCI